MLSATLVFAVPTSANAEPGDISTIAGNGGPCCSGDGGPAISAQFGEITNVAVDASGNIYVLGNGRIRKIDLTGIVTTIAGTGTSGFNGDGIPATNANLASPADIDFDSAGNIYFTDGGDHRIRKIDSNGIISTIAGVGPDANYNGGFGGDGGPATSAQLFGPSGIAIDSAGNVIFADSVNQRIRKIDTTGIISTIAGNGSRAGFNGDDIPALDAYFNRLRDVAIDDLGNIYVSDSHGSRIRKIDATTGLISTIAGDGTNNECGGDGGLAIEAQLNFPIGIALDSNGNVYIADEDNNRVRVVDANSGVISTVAGGDPGPFGGDGGPATAASLRFPMAIAFDSNGNLIIADSLNNRIRKVETGDRILPSSPSLMCLTPKVGPPTGGTLIEITGDGLVGEEVLSTDLLQAAASSTMSITVGGKPCQQVEANQIRISCLTPPSSAGSADVVVTRAGGQSSTLSSAFTYQVTTPSKPKNLAINRRNTSATLSWSPPSSSGDGSITGYVVQMSNDGSTWQTVAQLKGSKREFALRSVKFGLPYLFQVAALNSVGQGSWSAIRSTVFRSAPGAPRSLKAVAGNATVTLTWTPPLSDGGSQISGYQVLISSNGRNWTVAGSTNVTNFVVANLTRGVVYRFKVSASNQVGEGPPSPTKTARPK